MIREIPRALHGAGATVRQFDRGTTARQSLYAHADVRLPIADELPGVKPTLRRYLDYFREDIPNADSRRGDDRTQDREDEQEEGDDRIDRRRE